MGERGAPLPTSELQPLLIIAATVAELCKLLTTPGSEAMAADIYRLINLKQQSNLNRLDPSLAIPKLANIKLEDLPVRKGDLFLLHFSKQLEWMINLTLATIMVHAITLVYYYVYIVPSAIQTEYNLATIWLVLVFGYVVSVLASLTKVYFSEIYRNPSDWEKSLICSVKLGFLDKKLQFF